MTEVLPDPTIEHLVRRPPRPLARGRRVGSTAKLLGPALVAGVAYLDPGNVASNVTAGARYGFLLVWVVVLGNLMAWLIQYLSAKLGLVTGRSLPELLGVTIRSPGVRRLYWAQAELVAVATDLAEIVGGAIALGLLFRLPLVVGGTITAVTGLGILLVQRQGRQRSFEAMIVGLLAVIVVGFTVGAVIRPPEVVQVVGGLIPRLDGSGSLLLAASILGATVMPHAIYGHSALARDRFWNRARAETTDRLIRATRWDVTVALGIAGSVNVALLLSAATSLHGVPGTDTLEGAYAAVAGSIGPAVATIFAVGLLASGLASTSVGAYAGAEIMHGLLRVRIPIVLRRVASTVPALVVLGVGVDPTRALILSQIVLSFGIPFALVPLIWLTSRHSLLGSFCNRWPTNLLSVAAAVVLISLNVTLLCLVSA